MAGRSSVCLPCPAPVARLERVTGLSTLVAATVIGLPSARGEAVAEAHTLDLVVGEGCVWVSESVAAPVIGLLCAPWEGSSLRASSSVTEACERKRSASPRWRLLAPPYGDPLPCDDHRVRCSGMHQRSRDRLPHHGGAVPQTRGDSTGAAARAAGLRGAGRRSYAHGTRTHVAHRAYSMERAWCHGSAGARPSSLPTQRIGSRQG